jgi:superfamily II DNA or RNA helicase
MARAESKMVMGYLPIEPKHHAAILSLVQPATPAVRLLDPFAGEGAFLEVAAQAWNVTPYANELDGDRAAACINRFGATQAIRCDVERLVASNNAFGAAWLNPPYDHDAGASGSKRVEFRYLRHAWKWVQDGGLALWCIYRQHITTEAAAFLAKHSSRVDVWALPGKHLGEYDQMVIAAIKGVPLDPTALYKQVIHDRDHPQPLTVQAEPIYRLPAPRPIQRFVFAPDMLDEAAGLALIQEQGAWKTGGFQALLEVPPPPTEIEPVVAPRPGHLALVLAAGVADGAVIESEEYGRVALRGKTRHVEQVARVEVEADPNDPERQVKKTTIRLKPTTTLTLLGGDGTCVEMEGDEALLGFITSNKRALAQYLNAKFQPMYRFDLNGIARWLDGIRLKGKHTLYTAQKHVVAAVTRGLQDRDSILLIGQMGVGKTALGGASAVAIASHIATAFQGEMRGDQVTLIVAPPHLIEKWKRELASVAPKACIERLDRHEQVREFMQRAEALPPTVPKIGLIKRDLTKLGCAWESSVVWRTEAVALWRYGAPVPDGYLPHQRLRRERVPKCPHCGSTVMQEKKGVSAPASLSWLEGGKRVCSVCSSPLWRESRDRGSLPKPGEKYPPKNPRYRLDEYLKRMFPDRVYLLIWDECHEAQHGDTGNGEAFSRMAGLAKKVLAMTGTPFNGRASSIFNLEYALNPRVRQRYNWGGGKRFERKTRGSSAFQEVVSETSNQRGRAESRWVADMGVREQVVEERPSYDRDTGAYTGTSTYERPYQEAPGISPLLVAEVLDHAIFFSLGDLGKALPHYEEIALSVELDADVYAEYDRTRQRLKDYLIQRRWEGDATFRGAYLQWSMGWVNAPFRPYEVIHNIKHPITGVKEPYTVASIPSCGEERIYAKEQALIDLVRAELAADRPCVIYFRQTATRDIQPRLESLIRQHVPEARTFILKNTVDAERREAVIEREIAKGVNVVLCNPELVKTGLDLIHFPTLIFYELVFNLSTLMQAAARSYRLNQTHAHCKVFYLYAEGTMEQTAVQLMSRKQRAAKLLTGDIGLTGLDALTEGEGGFEEALLEAIGRDETLLDPSQLFKATDAVSEIDIEDAGYWNVKNVPLAAEAVIDTQGETETDPLIALAREMGATVTSIDEPATAPVIATEQLEPRPVEAVIAYLETVHLIADEREWTKRRAELLTMLDGGTVDVIAAWLTEHRIVFPGFEREVATKVISLISGQMESDTATSTVKPTRRVAPKRTPRAERPPLVFPQREAVYEEALTQQLSLF